MFQNWGFLISEMVLLIILAALLGLIVGWIIWGRRSGSADTLRADLTACRKAADEKAARISTLEASLAAARAEAQAAEHAAMEAAAEAVAVAEAVEADHGRHPVHPEAAAAGAKPATLTAPRAGKADDLKRIKGIGPKLEKLCNALGVYHFDQIAGWTADEIAWVDANLEGFKGRVSRDDWVAQAKALATGG